LRQGKVPINYALLDKMEMRDENISLRLPAVAHKSFIFNIFIVNCRLYNTLARENPIYS
jgi:hypothetical protein